MMSFAEKIVRDATGIAGKDVEELKSHGFSDAEIFDITTIVAARCFFSKTLDALGADPDPIYHKLADELKRCLTVGRSFDKMN
jgi:alkylhydroperoxidase family enzyme